MTAVFWLIVVVGVALTIRAIVSDRRNPPMRKCFACDGDGIVPIWHGVSGPLAKTCAGCGGDGWVVKS
jgi:hypothetical protein